MENKTDTFFKKNIEYGTSKLNNETLKVNKISFGRIVSLQLLYKLQKSVIKRMNQEVTSN
jgi:hypothetical protein